MPGYGYDTTPPSPGGAVIAVLLGAAVALGCFVAGAVVALLGPMMLGSPTLLDSYGWVAGVVTSVALAGGSFAGAYVAVRRLYRAGYETGALRIVLAPVGPVLLAVGVFVFWLAGGGDVPRGALDVVLAVAGGVAGALAGRAPYARAR